MNRLFFWLVKWTVISSVLIALPFLFIYKVAYYWITEDYDDD